SSGPVVTPALTKRSSICTVLQKARRPHQAFQALNYVFWHRAGVAAGFSHLLVISLSLVPCLGGGSCRAITEKEGVHCEKCASYQALPRASFSTEAHVGDGVDQPSYAPSAVRKLRIGFGEDAGDLGPEQRNGRSFRDRCYRHHARRIVVESSG